ncbi:MAG: hypothetical protein H7325_08740 [Pedobacter sp.]|nr:hypothetical protein [Pedobacter sp.]
MIVVMGGLGTADPKFVESMIEWCKKNRGFKPNGNVDLCFDVINYHLYANDADAHGGKATAGVAPELSSLTSVARNFLKMAREKANDLPVWVTESGYDVGSSTPQRAIPIGKKNSRVTQADWNLRTALLYARLGIKKSIFYMLDDVDLNSTTQYSSSGFVNADGSRRPSADYFLQTKKLIGDFNYVGTINNNPIVDVYKHGDKKIFVLTAPNQNGSVTHYQLNIGKSKQPIIHFLQVGKNQMIAKTVHIENGKLNIEVSETPVFVEPF